ncbi:hypothetical protein GTQ99_09520 [Kineococcus sp. T13]|uniref:hypothetical protein n=1 Tax=Kineococcus vitellinus TaxID=2696565 RepID=UPI0014130BC2|nr:hypothetical protein [Kineococcus vitellinus]NAZ75654.1 hypothetical protein [Kineococcus vitellinus]
MADANRLHRKRCRARPSGCAADVTGYAEHCERLASAREGEAQRLEEAARAAGVPG